MSPEAFSYPWYTKIPGTNKLEQGDIVFKCQIVEPTVKVEEDQLLNADVAEYNVIIMSQSCDIQEDKIKLVLVCPFFSLTDIGYHYPDYKSPSMKNKLRQGAVVGFHLLNKDEDNSIADYLVVDFKSVYAVPLNFLRNIASSREERLRLLPPYREHLSQAFARFFMRVGLPVDIPKFT